MRNVSLTRAKNAANFWQKQCRFSSFQFQEQFRQETHERKSSTYSTRDKNRIVSLRDSGSGRAPKMCSNSLCKAFWANGTHQTSSCPFPSLPSASIHLSGTNFSTGDFSPPKPEFGGKSTRKKSTQNKKAHLNEFIWTISAGFLTRVTCRRAKSSRKRGVFFCILGFWVGFGPLKRTRIWGRILGNEFWTPEFFGLEFLGRLFLSCFFFQQQRPPEKLTLKKFNSRNSSSKIQPRNREKIFTLDLCKAGHLSDRLLGRKLDLRPYGLLQSTKTQESRKFEKKKKKNIRKLQNPHPAFPPLPTKKQILNLLFFAIAVSGW